MASDVMGKRADRCARVALVLMAALSGASKFRNGFQ